MSDSADSRVPFGTLAARIREAHSDGGTLAVTASLFAEGASTVALGLALSLESLLREPVLLIDANWLDPTLTHEAGAKDRPGLTDWLRGTVPFASTLQATKSPRLTFLPVGALPTEGAPLGSLRTRLDRARQRFHYVVIDLPPVLAAEDVVLLWTSAAEQTLVVVRADATPFSLVRRALDEIDPGHATELVINRTATRSNGFRHLGAPAGR